MTYQLHLGDCIEGMRGLADKSVAHLITDPPYSEHVHAKQWIGAALTEAGAKRRATTHTDIGFASLTAETRTAVAMEAARLATRWSLIFCDIEGVNGWIEALRIAGLDYVRTLIWDKVDSAPQFTGDRPANAAECAVLAHPGGRKRWNAGGKRNVYRHAVNGERGAKSHPTQKPIALMREILTDFTDVGDLVLDPFAGSGTTGAACIELGRDFIGFEQSEIHWQTANTRLLDTARQGQLFTVRTKQEQTGFDL